MDPVSFPSTVTDLYQSSKKGEAYWASMNLSSASTSSILGFSERLIRHEASQYLVHSYFENYHNRFPYAYEPWIRQAMENAGSNNSQVSLQAGTQALLLSIIAVSSCNAEPWKVNGGQPVNLWWFGYAAHQASLAIVDPPFLHDKGVATWSRYTGTFLSPDLAQSFILIGAYLLNDSPAAVWRCIQLGWDVCSRQGFLQARADLSQRGNVSRVTASEICKEQGIRAVWALMKFSVTIYMTGRIANWPRFLVEFSTDLPSLLHDPSDPGWPEVHLNPGALESWTSAMPIYRLLLQILTSPLSPEWANQHKGAVVTLEDRRGMLHEFRRQIAAWKQDAECFKLHHAQPTCRAGHHDAAWFSINNKTRVVLRIAEDRLTEAHQGIVAEADQMGQAVSEEERHTAMTSGSSSGSGPLGGIMATTRAVAQDAYSGAMPVDDRVSAWFQTIEDDNLAWYCGSVPVASSFATAPAAAAEEPTAAANVPPFQSSMRQ